MSKEQPLRNIPNMDGFQFIGIAHDGSEHYCHVKRRDDGLHYMCSNTALYSDLRDWKESPHQPK